MEQSQIDMNKIITNLIEDSCKRITETLSKEARKKEIDFINKFSVRYKIAFKKYLEKAYDKYSKIKTLLYKTEPKYLYDFFECNDLSIGEKIIDPIDINNVLDLSHFIIIKGTGGIGKSTLMKHLFINELEKNDLIPIFFELKDLNNSELSLEESIYNSIINLGCNFEREYFEYAMKSGKFLILLDGYDEISNAKLERFVKDLEAMNDKYEKNYYIMSSRPNEDFISFQRYTVLESCRFSKEKAISLIKKIDYEPDTKKQFIRQLKNGLYLRHRSFASNPLLLTIMLLTYSDYAEIPDKLHIFYSYAFDALYTKHDATKAGYKREMKSKLSKDVFVKIFSEFCFRSYMKEKFEFSEMDLNQIFYEIKKKGIQFDNEAFLQDLESSTCLMYKDGKQYSFTHRSFQEYFTARYILELSDELQQKVCRKLINYRIHDSVLDMVFDMSKERFEKNVLIPYLYEIEQKRRDVDKFEYYLSVLFDAISVRLMGEKDLIISVRTKNTFLREFIVKYKGRRWTNPSTEANKEKKEIVKRLKTEKDKRIMMSTEELLSDPIYYNYIKQGPWGRDVKILMELLENLEESHSSIEQELEDILK